MNPPFFALYTERPALPADLFVIFKNRDEQTLADVTGTKEALESQGYGVIIREYETLADIAAFMDLRGTAPAPGANERASHEQSEPSAIHACLKILAGQCDHARQLDGHGFNKMDADFGHSLANAPSLSAKQALHGRKLIQKYHRQLPQALFDQAIGTAPAPGAHEAAPAEQSAPDPRPETPEPISPAALINLKYGGRSGHDVAGNDCEEPYGDTYQVGVRPGPKKLAQFLEVLELMKTPKVYAQENAGDDAIVHVKLFDPSGSWTWYLTEFSLKAPDGTPNLAFGLVAGFEAELGYIDMEELATTPGRGGIGIELDMHFTPTPLKTIRETLTATAN